jgi:hypothetical protein
VHGGRGGRPSQRGRRPALRGGRPARRGRNLQRLAGVPFGLRERALEHPDLGNRREHGSALRAGAPRDQLQRATVLGERPVVVTGGAPVAPEPLVEQAQLEPPQGAVPGGHGPDRNFGDCRGASRLPAREGRLGSADEQIPNRRIR